MLYSRCNGYNKDTNQANFEAGIQVTRKLPKVLLKVAVTGQMLQEPSPPDYPPTT